MFPLLIGLGVLLLFGRNNSIEGLTGYATRKSKWFVPYTVDELNNTAKIIEV